MIKQKEHRGNKKDAQCAMCGMVIIDYLLLKMEKEWKRGKENVKKAEMLL